MKRLSFLGFLVPVILAAQPAARGPIESPSGQAQHGEVTAQEGQGADAFRLPMNNRAGLHVLQVGDRGVTCRAATEAEAQKIRERDPNEMLRFFKGGDLLPKAQATGLNISLRGTSQLDSYPQAKAAFIRAASRWEAVIHDPISIIIDVDFGPQRFGTPYSSATTLGSTMSDMRQGSYSSLSSAMKSRYPTAQLLQHLPALSVPTDHGSAQNAVAPAASLRMLGLLPRSQLGTDTAPSIGFNSAHSFDFDPTDGIDAGSYDFDAVVTHEMGHVLGFDSVVGDLELHPTDTLVVSSWDLFRFRAAVTVADFNTTERILSSGGTQVFSDSANQAPLSTGRTDGSGGDGQQAEHWKDYLVPPNSTYWGIMEPVLPWGYRASMTSWDLDVLAWLGYNIPVNYAQAYISSVSPTSSAPGGSGFTLTVDGSFFQSGAMVLWKGSPRQTTFVSDSQVTALISAADSASVGAASVEVVNPGALPSNTAYVTIGRVSAGSCAPSITSLCLDGNRFRVTAHWLKSDGTAGDGTAVALTADTGYFWFFDPTNVEVITKVLEGCALNSHRWVFASGLTNVGVTLTYTDTLSSTQKTYTNAVGVAFQPVQDTQAFACN